MNSPYSSKSPRTPSHATPPERVSSREKKFWGAKPTDYELDGFENEQHGFESVRQRMEDVKDESVSTTNNALRRLRETEEMATKSMESLHLQNEKLANVENRMVSAEYYAESSGNKTDELKKLNRNFLIAKLPSFGFNKKKKEAKLAKKLEEQQAQIQPTQPIQNFEKTEQKRNGKTRQNQLDDEQNCGKERQIEENLDEISSSLGRLAALGREMNTQVVESTERIDRISGRANQVTDQVNRNERKLRTIK